MVTESDKAYLKQIGLDSFELFTPEQAQLTAFTIKLLFVKCFTALNSNKSNRFRCALLNLDTNLNPISVECKLEVITREPPMRIELMTFALRERRSTD